MLSSSFVNIIKIIVCLFLFATMLISCGNRVIKDESQKIAHWVMYRVMNRLKDKYHLHFGGFGERGTAEGYRFIGMDFDLYDTISKEEGRRILVESVHELVNAINEEEELQPYLLEKPFTPQNVEIVFFAEGKDREGVYYPDITVFSARGGKISYKTESPDDEYGYYTEEEETFEEALRILKEQEGG